MRKWTVLGVFALVAGLSQLLWLNFAPLIDLIQKKYTVTESQASLLILVFPLIYVFLSIPTGILVDKKGYRFTVGVGAVLMALFASLRIHDQSFMVLLIAQVGIAIAQPFVINGISKLVMDWFPKDQSALATGIGTMGMFIGMAAGLAATPPLVENFGFINAMLVFALVSVASCILFFVLVHENPKGDARLRRAATIKVKNFKKLLLNGQLALVFTIAFLGLGFFNGLTTWLELILAPHGINSMQAGMIGGLLIIGGIVGAVVIPGLSDHFRCRKPFLIAAILIALATLYPLCMGHDYKSLLLFGALQGFFFLPAFSLLLEVCSELSGEVLAGSATSILMLTGNAGGVVVIIAMEAVKTSGGDFTPAVHLLAGLLAASVVLASLLAETHRGRGAKHA